MKITQFKYENKSLEWILAPLFLNKLTLLVGASGVGKTQILLSLMSLKKIAEGASMNGVAWYIEFETLSKQHYIWEGEFENKGVSIFNESDKEDKNKFKILSEKISCNTVLIVDRNIDRILFEGKPTLKLSQYESIISLLKEEETINPAYQSIKKLYFVDHSESASKGLSSSFNFLQTNSISKQYNTLQKIQEGELEILPKLFFLSKVDQATFTIIKNRFADIFPQVEDLKIAPLEINEKDIDIPDFLKEYPFLQIKEKGVSHWINESRISSGMLRTLMQLSELYLCSEGTVFLIDEFENSLGINCIDEITNDILISKRKLQFLLTSHHPYIINTIDYHNWKLVTRNAGIIKTHDIDQFKIGNSKHDAFMQLIQLEEYQTGQEQ